jgi:hypothetical protein
MENNDDKKMFLQDISAFCIGAIPAITIVWALTARIVFYILRGIWE